MSLTSSNVPRQEAPRETTDGGAPSEAAPPSDTVSEDEDRDTLVSNQLKSPDEPPLLIEVSVEMPKAENVVDPSERVLAALEQSLKALGWRPTVLCARRFPRSEDAENARR